MLAATSLETSMLEKAKPRVILLDVGLRDKSSLRFAKSVRKEMAIPESTGLRGRKQ